MKNVRFNKVTFFSESILKTYLIYSLIENPLILGFYLYKFHFKFVNVIKLDFLFYFMFCTNIKE